MKHILSKSWRFRIPLVLAVMFAVFSGLGAPATPVGAQALETGTAAATESRLLQVDAEIYAKDDENWPDNHEYGKNSTYRIDWLRGTHQQRWFYHELRFGGEIRIELVVDAQALPGGSILLTGTADLYEGTHEGTTDHNGSARFAFVVWPNLSAETVVPFTVRNTDEGGDWARITIKARCFIF